ncbi:MAG TPA: DUF1559 domain-containing protein [Planctomycetaceae bacterium]|nr:DUF1559 domain-containing protein [Planctomycetaceae bacterium]
MRRTPRSRVESALSFGKESGWYERGNALVTFRLQRRRNPMGTLAARNRDRDRYLSTLYQGRLPMAAKELGLSRRALRRAFTLVEMLVVIAVIGILVALLLPAVAMSREAVRRMVCSTHLAQLGLALHQYQDVHLVYPPGTIEKQGPIQNVPKGYHFSWTTSILPYLERRGLDRAIDRSVGVYAKQNASVYDASVQILLCPSDYQSTSPMTSSYAGVHHPTETPIDADNLGVFFLNSRLTPDDIADGLNHTFFLGEKVAPKAGVVLGWMSGTRATLRNMGHSLRGELEPAPPSNLFVGGFGSMHADTVQFLLGSGAVVSIPRRTDLKPLQQLSDRRDGALVDEELYLSQ